MTDRPTLSNGYLWVCDAAMSAARARRIVEGLGEVRKELYIRDVSLMGEPRFDTIVEMWVHPDDDHRVLSFLAGLPADL